MWMTNLLKVLRAARDPDFEHTRKGLRRLAIAGRNAVAV
jgi:hypothetical protein